MTATLRPTPTRLDVLRWAAEGRLRNRTLWRPRQKLPPRDGVQHLAPRDPLLRVGTPDGFVPEREIEAMTAAGWITPPPADRARWSITDAGRAVLGRPNPSKET